MREYSETNLTEGVWNPEDFKDYSPSKSEKPKRLKPRRVVRSLSFRLGRFQVVVTLWKWRKV